MNNSNINKIFSVLSKKAKYRFVYIFFLLIISMLLETLGIGLALPIISMFSDYENINNNIYALTIINTLGIENQSELLFTLLFTIISFYSLKVVILSFIQLQQARFTFQIQEEISERLFTKYINLDYLEFNKINTSIMLKNIIKESQVFAVQFVMPSINLLAESLVLLGIISVLLYIEPIGALVCFLVISISALIFYGLTKKSIGLAGKSRTLHDSRRIQVSNEAFGVFKHLKLNSLQNFFKKEYGIHNKGTAEDDAKLTLLTQLPRLLLEWSAILAICIFLSILLYREIPSSLFIPYLGVFGLAAYRIMPSINRILIAFNLIKYTDFVVRNIYEILINNTGVKKVIKEDTEEIKFNNEIIIKDLKFYYDINETVILKNINLVINKGSKIGLKGKSGSGKSTLVDLMLGIINPISGNILLDGKSIKNLGTSWSKLIGYVPQNIYLIDGSIKSNIALGIKEENIDYFALDKAIKDSSLNEFIDSLPNGIDTNVGEIGSKISGGQMQRIGIARAILNNPDIIFLDEATSALDSVTEHSIMETILKLGNDKTVIFISHKDSSLLKCDEVYELSNSLLVKI